MTATTGTPPAIVTCPPSSVADQIVRWDEVRDGDLALIADQLELVEHIEQLPWLSPLGTYLRIAYRGLTIDKRPFDVTAVRRYGTSEGE